MNELVPARMPSLPQGGVAVVFGASGGVGAALVEHLRASDHFAAVEALSRRSAPSFRTPVTLAENPLPIYSYAGLIRRNRRINCLH